MDLCCTYPAHHHLIAAGQDLLVDDLDDLDDLDDRSDLDDLDDLHDLDRDLSDL